MSVEVYAEADVIREASNILLKYMTPSKATRFWASWRTGQGDYLAWRDEEFADETVTSLSEKIRAYQETPLAVKE